MKKSKLINDEALSETSIDQYCRSVENLLKNINNKSGTKSKENPYKETRFMYHDEDLFEYEQESNMKSNSITLESRT